MNTFSISAHSCPERKEIIIDGTGPIVDQRYEFSHGKVEELSSRCEFFSWTLKLSDMSLLATDKLILSISEESEDLTYLDIQWRDMNDQSVSEDETKQLGLYIFGRERKLSRGTCYAHG
jgi:hypothetical protein